MSKVKGFCEVCGDDIEITLCCSSFDCGCRGLPIHPPVCSEKCYDILMEPKEEVIIKGGIFRLE